MQIKIEANEVHEAVLRSIKETMGDDVKVTSIRFVRERQGSVYAEAVIDLGTGSTLGAPEPTPRERTVAKAKASAKTQTGSKTPAKKPKP